jgi:hypothetical protein
LFRTFADTPITGDGVLGFANRFGMLGGSATGEVHPPESADPTEVGLVVACDEPLAEWADRVLSMRFAVSLWDLASSNNQNGLRDVIHADSAGIWFRPNPAWLRPDWRVAVAKKGGVKWPSWFEAERIRATKPFLISDKPTALEGFQKFGDIARAEAALVAMEAIADRFLRRAVSHRLCVDVEFRAPYIFQEPDSLGSALWLQFAEAITSGTRIRQCKECGEWFALPKRGARITREFCTDACRVRAHRRRQDRARVLSSRGNDPKDIARELDTTAAIVRRWLKTGKGK